MASLIEGYEYDIFFSYRQKDNKYDGWVTEFVENLKKELEATFKESVSVYFDENPHDRLQETHHVSKSLEGKLKCVIFIPILSQTYCDPGSYAWQFEFLVFNKMAGEDLFGKEIKLRSGNFASRILPIRIHDLEPEDNELFQKETGSALRAMDFVFKTASGVNRPLKPDDNPEKNLNGTFYRDQVNKVAHAIKEIILGMKAAAEAVAEKRPPLGITLEKPIATGKWQKISKPAKPAWPGIITGLAITVILTLAGIFFYLKIFQQDRKEFYSAKGEISVAVMPFQNLTNDTTRNFWQVLVQDNLITALSNASELKVRQTESILALLDNNDLPSFASLTPSMARSVSQKLDANVFVHGSINQIGELTRLNAKLIDSKTEEVFKSFQVDGTPEDILFLSDSLSMIIKNFLIIEMLKKEFPPDFRKAEYTNSPEAIKYFIEGLKYFREADFPKAIELLYRAIEIDPDFSNAKLWVASSYGNMGFFEEAKKWIKIVIENKDHLSREERLRAEYLYANFFETPNEALRYLRQRLEFDNQSPIVYYLIGLLYHVLSQYEKAIPEYERALEIYKNWGIKPAWVFNYTALGTVYHNTGQYRKERLLYKKAEKDFPDDPALIHNQAILALARGKTKQADEYLEKYESIIKDNGASKSIIQTRLGWIFEEAEKTDKAEEYLRNALMLEPENPVRMNNLAYFLIDQDLDIEEGMELMKKALEIRPDNYSLLHTKGWGLYKQGKYQEAQEVLQKSWDLRREQAVYDHEAYLHLEEAKKAAAGSR